MAPPFRILILTVDYGSGHRSAANALAAEFAQSYGAQTIVRIVNPFHMPLAPSAFRKLEDRYLALLRHGPARYDLLYRMTDAALIAGALRQCVARLLRPAVRELLGAQPPHAVIGVFPCLTAGVAACVEGAIAPPVLMTVVTDLGPPHCLWWTPTDDLSAVATPAAQARLLGRGAPAAQVIVTGVPVHPAFAAPRAPVARLRGDLGWCLDFPTVLLLGGGAGVGDLASLAMAIDASSLAVQLAIVTGTNRALEAQLHALRWRHPAYIYGQLPLLADPMHAADIVVTRAGGLAVSEALAAGKPLVIHGSSPGQERGNRAYVCAGGAGVAARSPQALICAISRMLRPGAYQAAAAAARRLARPQAALGVARCVWSRLWAEGGHGRMQ